MVHKFVEGLQVRREFLLPDLFSWISEDGAKQALHKMLLQLAANAVQHLKKFCNIAVQQVVRIMSSYPSVPGITWPCDGFYVCNFCFHSHPTILKITYPKPMSGIIAPFESFAALNHPRRNKQTKKVTVRLHSPLNSTE